MFQKATIPREYPCSRGPSYLQNIHVPEDLPTYLPADQAIGMFHSTPILKVCSRGSHIYIHSMNVVKDPTPKFVLEDLIILFQKDHPISQSFIGTLHTFIALENLVPLFSTFLRRFQIFQMKQGCKTYLIRTRSLCMVFIKYAFKRKQFGAGSGHSSHNQFTSFIPSMQKSPFFIPSPMFFSDKSIVVVFFCLKTIELSFIHRVLHVC